MLVTIYSACLQGLEGKRIDVEVDVARGLPAFTIVGLGDTAVQEAKERVGAALANCGFIPPSHTGKVTVNLAPAHLRKVGSSLDIPIALGFLLATKQIAFNPARKLFIGELSLNGRLRSAHGVLAFTMMAKRQGFAEMIVPYQNAAEACLVSGVQVLPVASLMDIIHFYKKCCSIPRFRTPALARKSPHSNFSHIRGQQQAKRALEIAAAGGHNVLMSGPPGSGKTLLAKAMIGILPTMTQEEILDVTNIYSVSGLLSSSMPVMSSRPFRSPHHSASATSLIGGGTIPRPGEVSLAHRGVLFLDEFPEFPGFVLEHLRQPLEDGVIHIARSLVHITYPCAFSLVAAMNPCPCGYKDSDDHECVCSGAALHKYQQKLSGPLLDRIDLHVTVPAVPYEKLFSQHGQTETSDTVRKRVERARALQYARYQASTVNAQCSMEFLQQSCALHSQTSRFLKNVSETYTLSARSIHRVLKVARTIADLDSSKDILETHVAEAVQYRISSIERSY